MTNRNEPWNIDFSTYDNLDAGRQLNCDIAERVFGEYRWTTVPEQRFHGKAILMQFPVREFNYSSGWRTADKDLPWDLEYMNTTPYSSDMCAAWQIVRKMISRLTYDNPDFEWFGPIYKRPGLYLPEVPIEASAWYVRVQYGEVIHRFISDDAPLAICRASLYVVDVLDQYLNRGINTRVAIPTL